MKLLELFKGTGSVGKVAKKMGYDVVSLDFEEKYKPDILTDILKWNYKDFPTPDYIWASPPCNTFSPLAYPLKERNIDNAKPYSDRAKLGTKILHKTLEIIGYFLKKNPKLKFCIENPHGMMRKDPKMKDLPMETTKYCLYGDEKYKPTDFWSNYKLDLKQGKCKGTITVCDAPTIEQRYRMPPKLIKQILTQSQKEDSIDVKVGGGAVQPNTDKYALQKVEIRNTMPLEEAKKHYKSITKRKPRKIRESTNFYQFRFLPPTKFESKSFRTKVVNDDIRLIYGKLKEPHHKLEGGGLFDYFTKAYDYVKNKVSDAFSYIKDAVSINDYSDSTKKNLGQYGEYPIIALQLRRVPIAFALDLALQGISAGEWERLKNKYGFDKFYHLSMVATLKGAKEIVLNRGRRVRQNKQLAIEKLEVVSVNENIAIGEGMETQDVIIPKDKVFTINGMFQKARDKVGDTRFFSYSALGQNNCQDFIALLLDVEGLYNEPEKQFVYQDISQLVKELPDTTVAASQGITHIGALANKYLGIGGSRVSLDSLYRDSISGGSDNIVIPKKEFVKEHKHLVKLLNKSDIPELKKEAASQAKELEMKGGAVPLNKKLYEEVKSIVYPKYKKPSAYRSGAVLKLYKERGGKFKDNGGKKLARWFKEEWKDVGDQEYPVYRPTKRITKDTPLTVDEIDTTNLKEQIKEKQKIRGKYNLKPFKEKKGGNAEYESDSETESSDSESDIEEKGLTQDEAISQFYEYMKAHKGQDIVECFQKWKHQFDIEIK
jgi:hypothetical protein